MIRLEALERAAVVTAGSRSCRSFEIHCYFRELRENLLGKGVLEEDQVLPRVMNMTASRSPRAQRKHWHHCPSSLPITSL